MSIATSVIYIRHGQFLVISIIIFDLYIANEIAICSHRHCQRVYISPEHTRPRSVSSIRATQLNDMEWNKVATCRFCVGHNWRSRKTTFRVRWALTHALLHVACQLHNNTLFDNQVTKVVIF